MTLSLPRFLSKFRADKLFRRHSQAMQDIFVLSLFPKDYKGTFIDIGCRLPDKINNTYLLEKNGWDGVSIDIDDYSWQWRKRRSRFVCKDALACDYIELLSDFPHTIDYLSIDLDGDGVAFEALRRVLQSGHDFRVITFEHAAFMGNDESDRIPSRKLLSGMGYYLICADVCIAGLPVEDWWVNTGKMLPSRYMRYMSNHLNYYDILNLK